MKKKLLLILCFAAVLIIPMFFMGKPAKVTKVKEPVVQEEVKKEKPAYTENHKFFNKFNH